MCCVCVCPPDPTSIGDPNFTFNPFPFVFQRRVRALGPAVSATRIRHARKASGPIDTIGPGR